ncbi:MAG: dihydrofolate reductase family protein [Candidatus Nanopelagicales bacterium]
MGRTVYYTASSLDGFIADERNSLDWLTTRHVNGRGPLGYEDFVAGVGVAVMGATTYQWILDNHVAVGQPWPYEMPTWVFTHRRLAVPAGADVRLASGDVLPVHPDLTAAAGGKDVWVVGGGDLAGQFADVGLLDEVVISYAPVMLGAGKPLLPRRLVLRLEELARNEEFACARFTVVRSG